MINKNCLICNKEFVVDNHRENTARFCSVPCMRKRIIPNRSVKMDCEICNGEFSRYPGSRQRFCSNSCKNRSYIGTKASEETRQKQSLAHMGLQNCLGKRWKVAEEKRKSYAKPKGSSSPHWRGGINREIHSLNNPKYREWRTNVFIRDGFRCRMANEDCEGKPIQAHHILRWAEYVELRYEVNNGITLCLAHHPRKRAEEKRLAPIFRELVSVSN